MTIRVFAVVFAVLALAAPPGARAQGGPPGGPPAVGVVKVEKTAITESQSFIGRVRAVDRVDLTARVTAFVQERLFI
jgi:membrane fusion protein, multidrug efflux system